MSSLPSSIMISLTRERMGSTVVGKAGDGTAVVEREHRLTPCPDASSTNVTASSPRATKIVCDIP